jgi:histidinol phosphatase-like enzyme
MEKAIYFDMDGTIANLYAVSGWLEMLRAYDETPYEQAQVMLNMAQLARALNKLKAQGYVIGIVSWLSKCPTAEYDKKVIKAKRKWLKKHLASVTFDEIVIVAHGTPKSQVVQYSRGILFDDEQANRNEWQGQAYQPQQILEILKSLIKE